MGVISELQRATHMTGVWIEKSLSAEGLSQAEANIMAFLATHPNSTINDAHHHFGHKRSTLTNVVDRLENRGYVRRRQNPTSRRSVCLDLTHEGRTVAADALELIQWLEDRVYDGVNAEDTLGFERVVRVIHETTNE